MVFVETPVFTAEIRRIWTDDEYAEFQGFLGRHPDTGDVIPGTSGLRKLRWAASGRGKRGGARVIYFHVAADAQILLLMIYTKARQDDLTPDQKRMLIKIVERWNDG